MKTKTKANPRNPRCLADECFKCEGRGVVQTGPTDPRTGIADAGRCGRCGGSGKEPTA